MRSYFKFAYLSTLLLFSLALSASAQDLGPGFTKVKDSIYTFAPDATTTKTFDEYEGYYTLLLKRMGEMAAKGKSLDEIKKELKMPEYADWNGQDRLGVNIDAAWKSVKK